MTTATGFRRWMRTASPVERAVTAGVTGLVVALLGWALVPAPAERSLDQLGLDVAFEPGPGSTTDGGGAADLDPLGTAGVGSAPGPSGPEGIVTAPSASSGAPTTAGRAGATGGAAPAARFTASDRGVTAATIKVGFTTISAEGTNNVGVFPNFRPDAFEAVDALVDHANKRGGVLGRRVQAVKVRTVFTDAVDQRKKCIELTETHGVFAVIDSVSLSGLAGTSCVATEHKTLLVSGIPGSSANARASFPYHVSVFKDDNRKMKDLVSAARSTGFFDPAKGFRKLGVYVDTCNSMRHIDAPTDGLRAYLRGAGVPEWSEYRAECDLQGLQRGGPEGVLQFQQQGVSHVLLVTRPPVAEAFVNAASGAGFRPKWFLGDYLNLITGPFNDRFEPEVFDGAMGVTQTHAGEGVIGKPLSPTTQACSKIFTDHGLAPVSSAPPRDLGEDLEVLGLCENFLLFLQVATAAGPHLTRSTWAGALSGIGEFRGALSDLARFDRRGKVNGGDTTKLVRWHRDCTCWKEISGFGPAAG